MVHLYQRIQKIWLLYACMAKICFEEYGASVWRYSKFLILCTLRIKFVFMVHAHQNKQKPWQLSSCRVLRKQTLKCTVNSYQNILKSWLWHVHIKGKKLKFMVHPHQNIWKFWIWYICTTNITFEGHFTSILKCQNIWIWHCLYSKDKFLFMVYLQRR